MRDIVFRGKRVDNDEWVEGYYGQFHNRPTVDEENSHQIFEPREDAYLCGSMIGGLWHIVAPNTIGQYTGLTDKNGKRIFEGDIVKTNFFGKDDGKGHNFAVYDKFSVKWNDCGFVITNQLREFGLYKSDTAIEVIGNVHDNPELLA